MAETVEMLKGLQDSASISREDLGVRTESAESTSAEECSSNENSMTWAVLHSFPPRPLELAWRELLTRVGLPSHYTSPEYFCEPYFDGKSPFAILVLRGKSVVAVLTGFHNGNEVTCGLPTRPQVQIDPAADSVAVLEALVRGLEQESRNATLISIYSWEWLSLEPIDRYGYRTKVLPGDCVLDLKLGPETLLKQCYMNRRQCIRYAIKHGVQVLPATTTEDFQEFYRIYADWCTSKKQHQYSYETEELAFRTTACNRRLLLARHSGKTIAGSVFRFIPGGMVEYSRNSSLPEHQNLKPNHILVWRAVEWACENGFALFSLGGSHRFLREFGGPITPIVRYRLDRTLLRRHDRREALADVGRKYVGKMPAAWQTRIRRMIGRELPAGW